VAEDRRWRVAFMAANPARLAAQTPCSSSVEAALELYLGAALSRAAVLVLSVQIASPDAALANGRGSARSLSSACAVLILSCAQAFCGMLYCKFQLNPSDMAAKK
jgi:hypothetical protein